MQSDVIIVNLSLLLLVLEQHSVWKLSLCCWYMDFYRGKSQSIYKIFILVKVGWILTNAVRTSYKLCNMVFEFCIWIFTFNIIIACHMLVDQIKFMSMGWVCYLNVQVILLWQKLLFKITQGKMKSKTVHPCWLCRSLPGISFCFSTVSTGLYYLQI